MIVTTLRGTPRPNSWPAALGGILPDGAVAAARATISSWDGYRPTPLLALPQLARRLGVAAVQLKHEGARFEVGSFKALGPSYALERALARAEPDRGRRADWTAIAATSGNHGRAVAWAARRSGIRARIYMPAHASPGREAAIRALGADVERVAGSFDDALAAALAAAALPRTIVVADVPRPGAAAIAQDTLAGYAVLGDEIADDPAGAHASHLFVAAGNGSLAAATAGRILQRLGRERPLVVSVEPTGSDVVRRSLAAGAAQALADPGHSLMDGLVVGAPAPLAWPILAVVLDAALAIDDDVALTTLRALAAGRDGDEPVEIGETGIAAIAGLAAAGADEATRAALGIDMSSRLLAIVCEGVTDRAVFDRLLAAD
ncbi:MAG: diaminopropionate ammonia-lyase [Alphaproteobacteria bacterium]|nr:diaminopropionate ammonia-lyase [Alphaproteobacteria bacterium]